MLFAGRAEDHISLANSLKVLHLHVIHLPNCHHPLAKVIVMFQSPDIFEL